MSSILMYDDTCIYKFEIIHGHLHTNRVLIDDQIDPRYHCVCVEQTEFKPIQLEEVFARIEAEGGIVGFKTQGNN